MPAHLLLRFITAFERMKTKKAGADSSSDLEKESRRMEERLHVLKKMMSIEKASRESTSATHFWGSSQTSPPSQSGSGTGDREPGHGMGTKRPLRVKLLKDEAEKVLKSRKCGQCEKPSAKVACIECGEDYCLACFARFHQKGALSKHRVKPIKQSKVREVKLGKTASCGTRPAVPQTTAVRDTGREDVLSDAGGSGGGEERALWEGDYDEKASAQSFQEALAEWRAAHAGINKEPAAQPMTQAASCSTQTLVDPRPNSSAPDTEKGISFGKYSGGVSYFERMMIRRHQTDPESLIPSHSTPYQNQTSAEVDSEEDETDGGTACPSKYNIFHSGRTESGPAHYSYSSLFSLTHTTCTDTQRPASSVRIEEVKFPNSCCNDNSSRQSEVAEAQSRRQKSVTTTQMKRKEKEGEKDKRCPLLKKPRRERRQKGSTPASAGPCSLKEGKETSSSSPQTFSETVTRVLQPHTKVRTSTGPQSEGKLANFFLSGLEEHEPLKETKTEEEEGQGSGVKSGGNSNQALPISATIWLPENSLPLLESESVNDKHADPLDHSVYCIKTELPPPSSIPRSRANFSLPHPHISAAESDTESEREEELGDDSSREEDTSEGYGRDSEALEDLAWELQSLTSGRCTRCEGEGEGDFQDASDWGVGGGDGEREEIEAEIERVKSSFEIYQQQLMQQDSD